MPRTFSLRCDAAYADEVHSLVVARTALLAAPVLTTSGLPLARLHEPAAPV